MSTKEITYPALELPSATKHGSGSSTGTYFKIEVRNNSSMPKVIGDAKVPIPFVIDNYWRTLPIYRGATAWGVNIPIRSWHTDLEAADHGLVSYTAAEAHRWAFLAALEAGTVGGSLCIETRLVAVELHKTYTTKEKGVTASLSQSYREPELSARAVEDSP